jgi:hypothetical protein
MLGTTHSVIAICRGVCPGSVLSPVDGHRVSVHGASVMGFRKSESTPSGLEGEACGAEEYARYKTIVCTVVDACNCADSQCSLTWCADYVHEWKMEFGACSLKGC